MPWAKAQNYCRENHIDLATVQTAEDWTTLQEVADAEKYRSFAWIGLYNDVDSWRWSYKEERLVFQYWGSGQPDNNYDEEECVEMFSSGYWNDCPCNANRYFFCNDERANATVRLVLIRTSMTWLNAQKYCRQNHTDLATVRSQEDNRQINNLMTNMGGAWIGLYRDSWKWSDQANFTSSTQLITQRLNTMGQNCVGLSYSSASIDDQNCASSFYFYCSIVKSKQQLIRVQVKASENADDATLSALVLNKLQQMLSDQDVTLTWRKQPDGKIFQKKKTRNASPPVC
ncbi:uncharacterized protein LOC120461284 [Pimephales promelas]|uniref:uncharacterized protein LOC120461284 n=1 Tax=Pimephales promelas TaxID=90988 RepID=UPI001955E050|nr:uncharacterized protein LOC120461284 [Pimephales promelas]